MRKDLYISGLALLVFILLCINFRQCHNHKVSKEAYKAIHDTLTVTKDKHGREIASMRVASGARNQIIKDLKASNDSMSIRLAKLIKESGPRTITATIVETITKVDTQLSTIIAHDTVYQRDTFTVYPVYYTAYSDKWINVSIEARRDSIKNDITFYNAFDVTHTENRKGIFIKVRNNNPYTQTKGIKSFTVKKRRRRFGIGIHAGLGLGLDGRITPNVGLSAQYHLFQL